MIDQEEQLKTQMDRDIKEMLGFDKFQIKVTTFEESKEQEEKIEIKEKKKSIRKNEDEEEEKKHKNRILGTADYMAPEVIKGEQHTAALDLWALGVMAFEFLTGALPFNDETPEKVFKNIRDRNFKFWP